jgi:hypothetical protein
MTLSLVRRRETVQDEKSHITPRGSVTWWTLAGNASHESKEKEAKPGVS